MQCWIVRVFPILSLADKKGLTELQQKGDDANGDAAASIPTLQKVIADSL